MTFFCLLVFQLLVMMLALLGNLVLIEIEFEMLHDDEVIPKYAASIVIGRVKGQTPSLEI